MTTLALSTYRDSVRHVVDYLGGNAKENAVRYAKTAVLNAYREFATAARWTYYYSRGRVNTSAFYNTGTIQYTASTNQLVLTGGTWPSWAQYGTVVIQNISYDVATVLNSTTLQPSVNNAPVADIPAGTAYWIYRDTYPLPVDFVSADSLMNAGNFFLPVYVHPREWLDHQRLSKSPAVPQVYTYMGDPHYQGAMCVRFFPAPDQAYSYDFVYQRRPRPLLIYDVNAGTATATASSAQVTGQGTNWDSTLVGSVIRFSADNKNTPESLAWSTPYVRERIITAVTDATTLTVDNALDLTLSNVLYTVSDPVDIEPGAMLTAYLRCCEKQEALTRIMKNRADADAAWKQALVEAREADSRNYGDRVAGMVKPYRQRLAYMPRGADVS